MAHIPGSRTDIPSSGWIAVAPRPLRPFLRLMRLDRPIGTWLLLLPGWWSVALAGGGIPDVRTMALFLAGAVLMRGAGCTYNDIVDRDIDAKVGRTATRPLPAGEVSVRAAWIFLALQIEAALVVLLQFRLFAIAVGAASLTLVAVYPFMKRVTYWPQAWLGLTFNWGALLGWAAVADTISVQAVLLYAGGFFWTLGYDTIYAHQDREDDALAGVKSSALALGARTKPAIAVFYTLAMVLIGTAILWPAGNWPAGIALGAAAAHLIWQVATLDIAAPANCLARFRANRDFGLLVLLAVLLTRF
jgi:4-hydroxybenzoate polyprenyltransferase